MSMILPEYVVLDELYNVPDLPIFIEKRHLFDFRNHTITPHRNADLEMIRIISGVMKLVVGNEEYLLQEGDFAFIGKDIIHHLDPVDGDCYFICMLTNPRIFRHEIAIGEEIIRQLVSPRSPSCIYLPKEHPLCKEIVWMMDHLADYEDEVFMSSYLEFIGTIHLIVSRLYLALKPDKVEMSDGISSDRNEMNAMLEFIQKHYPEKITLDDIAASGNMSRSKCCQMFSRYAGVSPVDYLNKHRLTIGRSMLADSKTSVAEIAASCGFSHQSYFTKQFVRRYGITPREYRSRMQQ